MSEAQTESVPETLPEDGPANASADQPSPVRMHRAQPMPVPGVLPALQSLLFLLVVAMFLMTFVAQPIRIPSSSMEPTLLVGDFLLLDKTAMLGSAGGLLPPRTIRRGEVVVFHDTADDPTIHLVKRVVAVPGDRLHLRNGVLFLNGVAQQEPFAVHRTSYEDPFRDDFPELESIDLGVNASWWIRLRGLVHGGEITVPARSYFVLGDNRNNSEDSRYWGFVPESAIVGEPLLIYFSWKDPALRQVAAPSVPGHPPQPESVRPGPADFARWDRTFQVVH